jgi:hypothetical protein
MNDKNDFLGLELNQVKKISCTNSVLRMKNGIVHIIEKDGNVEHVYFQELSTGYFNGWGPPDIR